MRKYIFAFAIAAVMASMGCHADRAENDRNQQVLILVFRIAAGSILLEVMVLKKAGKEQPRIVR